MEEGRGGRGRDGDGDGSIADVVPLCRMLMLVYGGQQVVARSLAACLWRFIYIIWPILAAIRSRGLVQQRQRARAVPSNRDVFPAGSENILVTWPTLE